LRLAVSGELAVGVTAKDLVLALVGRLGAGGATGHAIEYTGETVRRLAMEARMTLANMAIEAGAAVGMSAPDETPFDWLSGRPWLARAGLLDVPGDERRPAGAGRALRLDLQPQLRGSAGAGWPHPSDEPADGGGCRGQRPYRRCSRADAVGWRHVSSLEQRA